MVAVVFVIFLGSTEVLAVSSQEMRAAEIMEDCLNEALYRCFRRDIVVSADLDPYGTGLIGVEFSPLTTTLGHLKDKRTSTHPLMASGMVRLFHNLGLDRGDVVAIGASASFPGLLVAVLSACEAVGLRPLVICSLGSSMYGANRLGATVVDLVRDLTRSGLVAPVLLGFSLGGRNDRDEAPLFPQWRERVLEEARRLGAGFILEPGLKESVERRLRLYEEAAGESGVRCFVGVGGAGVTFGSGEKAAAFPGGITKAPFDSMPREGLLCRYLDRGVPVIHLLCVRDIARSWDVPIDENPFLWRRCLSDGD